MQSAFFYLTNIIEFDKAKEQMKRLAEKTYSKAGKEVLQSNFEAIDQSPQHLKKIDIPTSWANARSETETQYAKKTSEYNEKIILPISEQREIGRAHV